MAGQNVGVAHQAAVRVHDGFRQRRRPGRGDQDEIIRGYYLVFGPASDAPGSGRGHGAAQERSHSGQTCIRRR